LRWNSEGEAVDISANEDGIAAGLLPMFKTEAAFDSAVKPLMDLSFVRKVHNGSTHFYDMPQPIQNFVQLRLAGETIRWVQQAINIVSHVLPEDENLEDHFETLRGDLTSHVLRCIEHAKLLHYDDLQNEYPQLISMLLTTLTRDGLEIGYVNKLIAIAGTGYHRCTAAKWEGYQ
jgi:hypothetical protein